MINYIHRKSLYLPTYLEISKILWLSNCHGEIFVEATVTVKNKIAIMFFNLFQSCLLSDPPDFFPSESSLPSASQAQLSWCSLPFLCYFLSVLYLPPLNLPIY